MLLKIGDTNEDVKQLQEVLGLTPTGYFGEETYIAVKQAQTNNNLYPDGIIGDADWFIITKTPAKPNFR